MSQSRPNIAVSGKKDAANIISFHFAENKPLFEAHFTKKFRLSVFISTHYYTGTFRRAVSTFSLGKETETDRYGEAVDEGSIILSYYLLYTRQSILVAQFV